LILFALPVFFERHERIVRVVTLSIELVSKARRKAKRRERASAAKPSLFGIILIP
jgi:hypothetical protein